MAERLRVFRHVGFFVSGDKRQFLTKGEEPLAGTVPAGERQKLPLIRKGIEMKSFLGFVLIAALGVLTIGCDSQKGTTENKTVTTATQTKDGKTTGVTTTDDTKTKTTAPAAGGTEKTTEKTTETTK